MRDMVKLAVIAGVFLLGVIGGAVGGFAGATVGATLGVLLLVFPWRGQPLWSWLGLYLRRNRRIALCDPVTVANDRFGGGVRYQDGIAAAAIHILGKRHQPTYFTGSTAADTADVIDISDLVPEMHHSLGLTIESMSIVSTGARRQVTGDYSRVYDTLVGTPPYAGQRETWLIIRIRDLENGDALHCRSTIGTATLAAAQRIAMTLRCRGIRARVATATEILELDRRLGAVALEPHNRRWHTARGEGGWQTTYAYRPDDIATETLRQAWSLRADGITQNVTLFPDGQVSATVTVRTPQPPTVPPAVALQSLPGEQSPAIAANLCGPLLGIRQIRRGVLPRSVVIPVGSSGVMLGKLANGERLSLPLSDFGEQTRVQIAAEDSVTKRIIIRAAGAGERVTVHTTDAERWNTVRMPHIVVTDQPRPAPGSTVSVIDGTVAPAPRPGTVISVEIAGATVHPAADIVISQTGRDIVDITTSNGHYEAQMEFFRAENRYMTKDSVSLGADLELVN